MKKNNAFLSISDVSKIEKLPYHRIIRKLRNNGYPNAYKVGHGWVIPSSDVTPALKKKAPKK